MVIRYLYVVRVAVNKAKTDPPLKVDGNRELSLAIPSQYMNTVAVKSFQVVQTSCDVQVLQASLRTLPHACRKPFRLPGRVQLLRVPVSKRLDHVSTVIHHVTRVNTGTGYRYNGVATASQAPRATGSFIGELDGF